MRVEIDQSGKVEDTHRLTIVAYSNGKTKILMVSAVEKQKLVTAMRKLDYPKKTFIFKIFAGLIFLLIRNTKNITELFIDREYPGYEGTVKNILLNLLGKSGTKNLPAISFIEVGKNSNAHKIAVETFRGVRKPDLVVKAKDVLRLFYS